MIRLMRKAVAAAKVNVWQKMKTREDIWQIDKFQESLPFKLFTWNSRKMTIACFRIEISVLLRRDFLIKSIFTMIET